MASNTRWRWKGFSYLRGGFSINEGAYPNIHMSYDTVLRKFFYYIALSPRWKWHSDTR